MCNAYELGKRGGSFSSKIKATSIRELLSIDSFRLIRRTDKAPVITADGELVMMRWGFERKGLSPVNNSRADKLDFPMWKQSFEERRCLIPVAAYYEWSGPKGLKRTHRFSAPDDSWLLMAGIWEESGTQGPCFSMITTEANLTVEPIHHRMPAILSGKEVDVFLAGDMRTFAPPPDAIQVADAPNPLVKKKPPPAQGELF
ncbi:SOS response-associated peptidase [Haloferula chungangensis]|uniref:Abasic site processing protein n=1 Tax=Haloferula chungangensis TaxID=1048331 RepID=A0ABW2LC52_9BACT